MAFEKRYIPLLVIIVVGVASAFVFLDWTTSVALDAHPNYDMIEFVPEGAYLDTLYLVFATIPWAFVAFLWSGYGAEFFLRINRLVMRSRMQSIESIEPKMSLTQLVTRAIVPAMFSYSITTVILQILNQLSVVVYHPIFVPPTSVDQQFRPFLANTLHQSLLFLPITLAIFIPTWILNDFMVISRLKDTKPGEFSDPVKVGQWVSGLLSGFSAIAFPMTFISTFLFESSDTTATGWNLLVNRTDEILLAMVSVLFIFLAYALPVIILYDASRSRIARRFFKVADRLDIDYSKVDTSFLAQYESKDESEQFAPPQYADMEDKEKLSSPDYEEMEAGVKLGDDDENDNAASGG